MPGRGNRTNISGKKASVKKYSEKALKEKMIKDRKKAFFNKVIKEELSLPFDIKYKKEIIKFLTKSKTSSLLAQDQLLLKYKLKLVIKPLLKKQISFDQFRIYCEKISEILIKSEELKQFSLQESFIYFIFPKIIEKKQSFNQSIKQIDQVTKTVFNEYKKAQEKWQEPFYAEQYMKQFIKDLIK